MKVTFEVINSLVTEKIIIKYAIGGAFGLLFHTEPTLTFDVDVFCFLPNVGLLITLAPLYSYLTGLGYSTAAEHIIIEGIPVQFLLPPSTLVEEAVQTAVEFKFDEVPVWVFRYEYLLAVMLETGRKKDKVRLLMALESHEPDQSFLQQILTKHGLTEKWDILVT